MRTEHFYCDKCAQGFKDDPSEGVTNAYVTTSANGSTRTDIVHYKDFCRECWNGIIEAIRKASE